MYKYLITFSRLTSNFQDFMTYYSRFYFQIRKITSHAAVNLFSVQFSRQLSKIRDREDVQYRSELTVFDHSGINLNTSSRSNLDESARLTMCKLLKKQACKRTKEDKRNTCKLDTVFIELMEKR